MHLTPTLPPGRANRKALAFCAEIQRLRSGGYSFEAIRLALRNVGVEVSRTTVKREAARRTTNASAQPAIAQPAASTAIPAPCPPSKSAGTPPAAAPVRGDSRSGREIAEAFMKDRISNPFIRERMEDEARRD